MLVYKLNQPFLLTETAGQYDVTVNVFGGGITGQAEAIRLGISRALCEINEEFRLALKPHGLLTRDARMVERKKFGQKKRERDSNSQNVNFQNSGSRIMDFRRFTWSVILFLKSILNKTKIARLV